MQAFYLWHLPNFHTAYKVPCINPNKITSFSYLKTFKVFWLTDRELFFFNLFLYNLLHILYFPSASLFKVLNVLHCFMPSCHSTGRLFHLSSTLLALIHIWRLWLVSMAVVIKHFGLRIRVQSNITEDHKIIFLCQLYILIFTI